MMRAAVLLFSCLALTSGLDINWWVTGEATVACVPVGETINFIWEEGHNAVELEPMAGPWSITLTEEGMYHYACGVVGHCELGQQKAMINVRNISSRWMGSWVHIRL